MFCGSKFACRQRRWRDLFTIKPRAYHNIECSDLCNASHGSEFLAIVSFISISSLVCTRKGGERFNMPIYIFGMQALCLQCMLGPRAFTGRHVE